MAPDRLNLEQIPPGDPQHPATGDIWSRLAASRDRLARQDTQEFDMPLNGLVVRYRRQGIEKYRGSVEPETEWERWAQLLIDHCDGFRQVDSDEDLEDLDGLPLRYDTLAERIGLTLDERVGVRGLVRDVFGSDENTMVSHAQRVDDWLASALTDHEADLAKGS